MRVRLADTALGIDAVTPAAFDAIVGPGKTFDTGCNTGISTNHTGPESCAGVQEDVGEALTGVHVSRVLSREKLFIRGADAVEKSGRQHGMVRYGERCVGPARSKTSRTHGRHLLGNREIPWTADARCRVEARIGKDAPVIR